MTNVGFTATQQGMSEFQKEQLAAHLRLLRAGSTLHHGDCIGGDAEADEIARALGLRICIHPPLNDSKQAHCLRAGDTMCLPLPYLERNQAVVDHSDVLIYGPRTNTEQRRSGTWSTVRYARRKGVLLIGLQR